MGDRRGQLGGIPRSMFRSILRSTMSRRQAQRLDVVFVAVMEMVSGGKLTRGVRRTPLIVLVAGGEGWEMGGYEKWDDRVIPFFGFCPDCAVWAVGALWYPL